jgi:hypothetical protein
MICIETDFVYIMLQGKYASVCICVQNPPPLTPIFLLFFFLNYCICLVSMQKEWRRMDSTLNHIHILTTLKLTKKQEFKKERKKTRSKILSKMSLFFF